MIIVNLLNESSINFEAKILDMYAIILERDEDVDFKGNPRGQLTGVIQTRGYTGFHIKMQDVCLLKLEEGDEDSEVDLSDTGSHTITLFGPKTTPLPTCTVTIPVRFLLGLDAQPFDGRIMFYEHAFGPVFHNRLLQSEAFKNADVTSPFRLYAQYAIMEPAGVAQITIQIRNQPGVTAISGSIYARPCSFINPVPLISDKETEVGDDGTISLKRSIIAVPGYASLVIGANKLCDQNGDLLSYGGKVFFIPIEKGVQPSNHWE